MCDFLYWLSSPRAVECNFMKTMSSLPQRWLPPGNLRMLFHQWGRKDISRLGWNNGNFDVIWFNNLKKLKTGDYCLVRVRKYHGYTAYFDGVCCNSICGFTVTEIPAILADVQRTMANPVEVFATVNARNVRRLHALQRALSNDASNLVTLSYFKIFPINDRF